MHRLIPAFEWGLQAAIDATRWVAGFEFPDFERKYEMISVCHPDEYPMNEGRIVSTSGLSIDVSEYETTFAEHHVEHSTALHSLKLSDQASYHVGPLARVNLNREKLFETARRVADEVGFTSPCFNPFKAIIARGLEVIHAFDEALAILRDYKPFKPSRIPYTYQNGEGCAATEAPRGLIYHRYKVDESGKVVLAKIVPPTSQNQRQIELDLIDWLPHVLGSDDQQTADDCERLIRSYDPCISCSTHFLKLTIDRIPASEGVQQ
jgi:sulfhydrogenase subunit alpha